VKLAAFFKPVRAAARRAIVAPLRSWWPRRLKLVWLTDDISLYGVPDRADWRLAVKQGVTAVLDVRSEGRDDARLLRRLGIEYQHFSFRRDEAPSRALLDASADWALAALEDGEKLLIHCDTGRQRSALVATATLTALGFPLDVAYGLLYRAEPEAALTEPQSRALEQFAAHRQRRRNAA
jgi:hypothetical protein